MTKTMSWKLVLVLVLFPVSAFAQLPFSAGYKPVVDASIGYSYVSFPIPSSTRINMNGLDASFIAEFRSRFGIKADLDYVRAANVLDSGRHSDVFTYMLGPMYYPVSNDLLTLYVQGLVGYSRIDGVVPNGAGGFNIAFTTAPSWAIGGGIERSITSSLAIRSETDYLHTSYTDATAAFRGQSDLRITSSLVYRWGRRPEGRYDRRRF
jgi:opacity protein-like surface antigen